MAEQPLDKKIMGVTHGFNQPSQQKPGIEMGFLLAKTLAAECEQKKTKQNEGRLSDFLDPIEPDHRAIPLRMCTGLQEKGRTAPKAIQRSSGLLILFPKTEATTLVRRPHGLCQKS